MKSIIQSAANVREAFRRTRGSNDSAVDGERQVYEPADVAMHYDDATPTYLQATGSFIQAYRSADTDSLMEYISNAAQISDGMHILDAGSGVGAPAIWLAKRFPSLRIDCLTISQKQHEIACRSIEEQALGNRISTHQGDYHNLPGLFPPDRFDRALFLESLGHSNDLDAVFKGLHHSLKVGALVYVKDMFERKSHSRDVQSKVNAAVQAINTSYAYNLMDLSKLVAVSVHNEIQVESINRPGIKPDFDLMVSFEKQYGKNTADLFRTFYAFDWYEVVLRKY